LPSAPRRLSHAATVGTYYQQMQAGNDLRYELAQVENEKANKTRLLNAKRAELATLANKQSIAEKELTQAAKQWQVERQEILKTFGGKIPSFVMESDALRKTLQQMSNKNEALEASLEVISENLQAKLRRAQSEYATEQRIAQQTASHNVELERKIRDLQIEKLELETELRAETQKQHEFDDEKAEEKQREYPPESTVIQNLLQAQVEFYFSDYNLKRDKRLLADVVSEPRKGFLSLNEVMKLSRIRQLCTECETLEEALRRSEVLTLIYVKNTNANCEENKSENDKEETNKIFVGRLDFEKPKKEFPFRRTVFLFGIPSGEGEAFLSEMLRPFGTISKIQFDHGSADGVDRQIGKRFLNKPRVYTLYFRADNGQSRVAMIFKDKYDKNETIKCHKCGKDKAVSEGFYTTSEWKVIFCAQCAAQSAEEQLNAFYKNQSNANANGQLSLRQDEWLGVASKDIGQRKTALVVFQSQRQASKCAYVRTRIAYNGCFATHFHHYSKVKKEIVLSSQSVKTINEKPKQKQDVNAKKEWKVKTAVPKQLNAQRNGNRNAMMRGGYAQYNNMQRQQQGAYARYGQVQQGMQPQMHPYQQYNVQPQQGAYQYPPQQQMPAANGLFRQSSAPTLYNRK